MDGAADLPGLGGSIAVSLVSLAVVCLFAYVSLRFLARRGVGRATGAIRVLARCPLEPRRSLYIVESAGRCFLVGVGDGPMTVLAELDRSAALTADGTAERTAIREAGASPLGFANVLARVLGRGRAPAANAAASVTSAPGLPGRVSPPPAAADDARREGP